MLGCLLRICAFAGIFLAAPLIIAAFFIFTVNWQAGEAEFWLLNEVD